MSCIKPFIEIHLTKEPGNQYRYTTCRLGKNMWNKSVDFINDPQLNDIRRAHIEGRMPDACEHCTMHPEDIFPNIENLTVPTLRNFMIGVGNLCNIACVICDANTSSTWENELGIVSRANSIKNIRNNCWKDWDLSNVEFSMIGGGEPLLNKEFYHLVDALEPTREKVHLLVHLNGTVVPKLKYLNKLRRFKEITFMFSIDDHGDQFEYIRYPSNWNKAASNMMWLRDNGFENFNLRVTSAIGVLNEFTHLALIEWLKTNYDIDKFGKNIGYHLTDVIGILSKDYIVKHKDEVFTYLDSVDKRRGTNWKKVFPEVYAKYK